MAIHSRERKDWKTALALYVAGLSYHEICDKAGCKLSSLKSIIHRERWQELRAETARNNVGKLARGQIALPQASVDLRKSGARAREKVATLAERLTDSLAERKEPKSLDGLQQTAETLQTVTKTLAIAHGWTDTTINAIVVSGDTSSMLDSAEEQVAIDVESVPPA